ncbi:MAG: NADH-quinone oxidoreductase subunit L, partial [Pseudomonadota bacterium]|nr:NADH-quinone oxidoreductase subunit L [Pseudomonadota bacterium]
SLYSFRCLFMTFFGECNYTNGTIKESPWTICVPLILLAIGAVTSGYLLAPDIMLPYGGLLSSSIFLKPDAANIVYEVLEPYRNGSGVILSAFSHAPFWLTIAGFLSAFYAYVLNKEFPDFLAKKFSLIYRILTAKFGFDIFNDWFFVRGIKLLSSSFYKIGDQLIIDKTLVNGSAKEVLGLSGILRRLQTGYLYHYTLAMVVGLAFLVLTSIFILK